MIKQLATSPSVASLFLQELRDIAIQKDPLRFRTNLLRLGRILGYELSKDIDYIPQSIITPLGEYQGYSLKNRIVVATILRAGLPLHQGVLECFDMAENAFIAAYRKYHKSGDFEIKLEYVSSPRLEDKILVLCDPMLATGASIIGTLKELLPYGTPKAIYIVGVIASKDAIDTIQRYDANIRIYVMDIDDELTAKGYIVPGLGDAGDLAYGNKVDV